MAALQSHANCEMENLLALPSCTTSNAIDIAIVNETGSIITHNVESSESALKVIKKI